MIKPVKITEDKDAYERVMGELRSRLKLDQPREDGMPLPLGGEGEREIALLDQ